jgi:hypothetical protein
LISVVETKKSADIIQKKNLRNAINTRHANVDNHGTVITGKMHLSPNSKNANIRS